MGILDELKNILNNENKDSHNILRNIIILGMIGILLLLFTGLFTNENKTSPPVSHGSKNNEVKVSYEERIAGEIEEIISLVNGVGKVRVKVYTDSALEYQYEYNESRSNKVTDEIDQNGGERKIDEDRFENELVIIRDASGGESPVVRKKQQPAISGILIVAQGAENSKIKMNIITAVRSLLNLPVHKISVLPYGRG
ncbi:stage III sporulation protein AG [Halocella sp. SP3-1]|uniref:stage III sporulation protein AG n=1 Tax=Halocella sp. SP3-1 TaxID=2382161 RepID=UPI000F756897|nr:stage III sporulation protein AG [Halocella sp. SP3-1]AZO95668.1 stage III sporulation protein AG [Halocella sp. SP3-1]